MFDTILASVISYISTNLDDLFLLTFLYLQLTSRGRWRILAGRFLGIGALVAVSLLGAYGLTFVPEQYIRLLGLVPIGLGVKEWLAYRRDGEDDEAEAADGRAAGLSSAALLTIASGADNIGVYIPLFAGFSGGQIGIMLMIYALMTILFCLVGERLAELPRLRGLLERYQHILVPVIFIALGIYILLD